METVGVVIGRFQVPVLHEGHRYLIDEASDVGKREIVVFIGVHPIPNSLEHPLDFRMRADMILSKYPKAIVLPLFDSPSDDKWSEQIDQTLRQVLPYRKFMLYGGRDSFIPHYKGVYPTVELEKFQGDSGTEIRNSITTVNSEDFRKGLIYAAKTRWPEIKPTVDIAIYDKKQDLVLLGQKKSNEGYWRFPGGFIGEGENAEFSACRELKEETSLIIDTSKLEYISSHPVTDWRNTSNSSILTFFFAADYYSDNSYIEAKDDMDILEWKSIFDGPTNFADGHAALMVDFINWYDKRRSFKIK